MDTDERGKPTPDDEDFFSYLCPGMAKPATGRSFDDIKTKLEEPGMHWSIEKALETLRDVESAANHIYVGSDDTTAIRMQLAILVTLTEIREELRALNKDRK